MKNSKKLTAAVLAIIMLTFCTVFCVNAATIFGIELPEQEDSDLLMTLTYSPGENSNVNCVYLPGPSAITKEGYIVVTDDEPLSIDYEFVHWEDEEGNVYVAGQECLVTGMETLYAVWKPKEDNDSKAMRVIKTCMESLSRIFRWIRSFITFEEDFSRQYYESKAAEEASIAEASRQQELLSTTTI